MKACIHIILILFGAFLYAQEPDLPELFAPGVVSTEHFEHSSVGISPDGKEIFWSMMEAPLSRARLHKIYHMQKLDGKWNEPWLAPFSGRNSDDGPVVSSDGKRVYFYSRAPYPGPDVPMPTHDIFYVEKLKEGWSDPVSLPEAINSSEVESSISFTREGSQRSLCQLQAEG